MCKRNTLDRKLHAHVASGNHNAVGRLRDFGDIVESFFIFDFGDNFHIRTERFDIAPYFMHFACKARKACGYKVAVHPYGKRDVGLILFAHNRKPRMQSDEIDVFFTSDSRRICRRAQNLCSVGGFDVQFEQAVGNEDFVPALYALRQIAPRKRNMRRILAVCRRNGTIVGSDDHALAFIYRNRFIVRHDARSDFRTFRIHHKRDRFPDFARQAPDALHHFFLAFVRTVRKVKARDIHTSAYHL